MYCMCICIAQPNCNYRRVIPLCFIKQAQTTQIFFTFISLMLMRRTRKTDARPKTTKLYPFTRCGGKTTRKTRRLQPNTLTAITPELRNNISHSVRGPTGEIYACGYALSALSLKLHTQTPCGRRGGALSTSAVLSALDGRRSRRCVDRIAVATHTHTNDDGHNLRCPDTDHLERVVVVEWKWQCRLSSVRRGAVVENSRPVAVGVDESVQRAT